MGFSSVSSTEQSSRTSTRIPCSVNIRPASARGDSTSFSSTIRDNPSILIFLVSLARRKISSFFSGPSGRLMVFSFPSAWYVTTMVGPASRIAQPVSVIISSEASRAKNPFSAFSGFGSCFLRFRLRSSNLTSSFFAMSPIR